MAQFESTVPLFSIACLRRLSALGFEHRCVHRPHVGSDKRGICGLLFLSQFITFNKFAAHWFSFVYMDTDRDPMGPVCGDFFRMG